MKIFFALSFSLLSMTALSQTENEKWCIEDFLKSFKDLNPDTITIISIKNSCIKSLPEEVYQLRNLKVLKIDFNTDDFKFISSEIGNLNKLESISLIKANLESFPPEFWQLKNLISIQIIGGSIKELPKGIGDLRNLIYIELRHLGLASLPTELQNLTQLKTLNLKGNNIPLHEIEALKKKLPDCLIIYDK